MALIDIQVEYAIITCPLHLAVAEITFAKDIIIPENIGVVRIYIILLGQIAPERQCVVTASTDAIGLGKPTFPSTKWD